VQSFRVVRAKLLHRMAARRRVAGRDRGVPIADLVHRLAIASL
jgi:hypothetical protein